jgi:hypothetical protein
MSPARAQPGRGNATKIFEGEYFGWIAQVATSLLHPTRLPEVYPDEHFTGTLLEK